MYNYVRKMNTLYLCYKNNNYYNKMFSEYYNNITRELCVQKLFIIEYFHVIVIII
jgi:hypothetical protein